MLLRHCPVCVRNLFSRLHWPRGRSIPGSWMVGSLINYLFGTSTIWFCHRVRQRCWMVGALSGRLEHIGRLDFSRGRGRKSISVSRGSSGLPRALRISLDVATSLRMSAGAILLRTSSQSVSTSDGPHGVIQLYVDEIGMCRLPPNWSTVLSHRIAEGQGWCTKSLCTSSYISLGPLQFMT